MSTGVIESVSSSSITIPKLLAIGSGFGVAYALWRLAVKDIILSKFKSEAETEQGLDIYFKHCYHYVFGYYIICFDITQHEMALGRLPQAVLTDEQRQNLEKLIDNKSTSYVELIDNTFSEHQK